MKTVYFYVQDMLADWEAGYAMAELYSGRFFRSAAEPLRLKTCALSVFCQAIIRKKNVQ